MQLSISVREHWKRWIIMGKNRKKSQKIKPSKGGTNRLALILAGWSFFLAGILTPLTGGGRYKGFKVYDFVGYIQFVGGAIILIYLWKTRESDSSSSDESNEPEDMICPKCQTVYLAEDLPENCRREICSECGAKLEPLDGFYERYPELKDVPEQFPQPEDD